MMFKLSKYRIVEQNDKFYPEERCLLFFWSRISTWDRTVVFFKELCFSSLKEAETFLKEQYIRESKNTKTIHKFKI